MPTDMTRTQQFNGGTRGRPAPTAGRTPPPPSISEESARRDKTDNDEFERQAVLFLKPTEIRPALVSADEVEKMRTGYSTGAGRLDVLTKTRQYREAYWQESQGIEPFDNLTAEQRQRAQKFFGEYGVRLADEPRVAPPNPIRAKEEQVKATEKPPAPAPSAEVASVATAQQPPKPAAVAADKATPPLSPPATVEIEFLSESGFRCKLTWHGATWNLALDQYGQALGRLALMKAKPIPVPALAVQAAGQGGGQANADGSPPKCKYHGAMKRSDKFAGWYCPKKLADGYCDQRVMD